MLLVAPGCGPSGADRARASARPSSPSGAAGSKAATDYALHGVIRSVAPESGRVLIRHEAIPGFMSAMTMPFELKDRAILAELHPGDEVEGTLHVEQEKGAVSDYELRALRVIKPAQPPALVLDVSKGKVQLRQQPRRLELGDPVPDLALTGQDGEVYRLSELRGKVVVLTFIYTRCPLPDFCPLMDRKFAALAQHLGAFPNRAKQIRLISISFDPEHDTPEVLRKHARIRGAVPPLWTYAVASHEELAQVAAPLGLYYGPGKDEVLHNLCTAVIDPTGRLARLAVGTRENKWEPADLLKTIYTLIPPGAN
jgi:protein SCO1/2